MMSIILLAGCAALAEQAPGTLSVRDAKISVIGDDALLALDMDCRLSGPMQDALAHGIPVTLQIDARAGARFRPHAHATYRIELRYFPLSRRYQLRTGAANDVRSFATPAYLMAALGSLRLPLPAAFAHLPAATSLRISAAIDPSALPGALRLPALFEPAWRLAAVDTTWPSPAH